MKEIIAVAILCAVLAGMAFLWRPAGDKTPRPEFPGGTIMEVQTQ